MGQKDLSTEIKEYDGTVARLSHLLTGVADALKGTPPPLIKHDWSDLPKVSAEAINLLREARSHIRTRVGADDTSDRIIGRIDDFLDPRKHFE